MAMREITRGGKSRKTGQLGASVWGRCVLAEGEVAPLVRAVAMEREIGDCRDRFAEELVDGAGGGGGEEHAFGIDPGIADGWNRR